MDGKDGNPCNEEASFECMVNYKLSNLDLFFEYNEDGGNISMKRYSHATGRLLIGALESVVCGRVSIKEKDPR